MQDPAGNLKPDKQKSSERIDGGVAPIVALGRAVVTSLHRHVTAPVASFVRARVLNGA